MDDLLFLVFVQCVAWRALFGFSACFVPVDLCCGWGVVFLSTLSFLDPFLLLLLFVSFRLLALFLYFFPLPFVCSLWWVAEVGFVRPVG